MYAVFNVCSNKIVRHHFWRVQVAFATLSLQKFSPFWLCKHMFIYRHFSAFFFSQHKHQKTSCVFLSDSLCPFVVSGNWKKVRDLGLDWRMGAEHFEWFGTEVGMCGCVCGVNGLWGGGGDSPSLPWCSLRFLNFQWIWLDCLTNWDVIPLLFPKVC